MLYRWTIDVVARVDIDGRTEILYQDKEFEVIEEDNEYIKGAIALGWAEELTDNN